MMMHCYGFRLIKAAELYDIQLKTERAIHQASQSPGDNSRDWVDAPRAEENRHGDLYPHPPDLLDEEQNADMNRLVKVMLAKKWIVVDANIFEGPDSGAVGGHPRKA